MTLKRHRRMPNFGNCHPENHRSVALHVKALPGFLSHSNAVLIIGSKQGALWISSGSAYRSRVVGVWDWARSAWMRRQLPYWPWPAHCVRLDRRGPPRGGVSGLSRGLK